MKSMRIFLILGILFSSTIPHQMRANSDAVVGAIVTAAVLTGLTGIGLTVKYAFIPWLQKRQSKRNYQEAIQLMNEVIAHPYSNSLSLLHSAIITPSHLVDHGTVFQSRIEQYVTEKIKNGRAKDGKKYHPELDEQVVLLEKKFQEAWPHFIKTHSIISSYRSVLELFNLSSKLQSTPFLFVRLKTMFTGSTWLVDARKNIERHMNAVRNWLASPSAYDISHYRFADANAPELMKDIPIQIAYLQSILDQIVQHEEYESQIRWENERAAYQLKCDEAQRENAYLQSQVRNANSDLHKMRNDLYQTNRDLEAARADARYAHNNFDRLNTRVETFRQAVHQNNL
jgi:hypothetical protein